MDHRGPEFARLGKKVLSDIRQIFKCAGPVVIYPSSGTGAWEAALVNTLSPGDKVLMFETGQFATLWEEIAGKLGLDAEFIASDCAVGLTRKRLLRVSRKTRGHEIKAVCVVHNETSTGATSRIADIRKAIDDTGHPCLLMVRHDFIACIDQLCP